MRPLAPALPSTVCRRSTSPSTICTRKAWSAMKPPWRTPAIRTTSSSKCKASIQLPTLRASKWSKPDLAPEEHRCSTCKHHQTKYPRETLLDDVSFIFAIAKDCQFGFLIRDHARKSSVNELSDRGNDARCRRFRRLCSPLRNNSPLTV